jgi:hypothetical protein
MGYHCGCAFMQAAASFPGPQLSRGRPSPYLLALVACVYGCTAGDLIDLADREQLPPAKLLILDTYSQEIPNLRNENHPSQLPADEEEGRGLPLRAPSLTRTTAPGA